jgi:hypothetical protein
VQQEDREHRPLTRAPKFDRPIVVEDFQRTEDSEVQHWRSANADATGAFADLQPAPAVPQQRCSNVVAIRSHRATDAKECFMLCHTRRRRLLAAVATAAALAATAPPALAVPIRDNSVSAQPERVQIVRVQVDEGLDWGDAGLGAAGMLALVLVGFGGARALAAAPHRDRTAVHS